MKLKTKLQFYHVVLVSPWVQTSMPGLYETLRLPLVVHRYQLADWEDRSQRLTAQFERTEKNFGLVTAGVSQAALERIQQDGELHILWSQPIPVQRSWNDRRHFAVPFSNGEWAALKSFLQKENLEVRPLENVMMNDNGQRNRQDLIAELKPWLNQ